MQIVLIAGRKAVGNKKEHSRLKVVRESIWREVSRNLRPTMIKMGKVDHCDNCTTNRIDKQLDCALNQVNIMVYKLYIGRAAKQYDSWGRWLAVMMPPWTLPRFLAAAPVPASVTCKRQCGWLKYLHSFCSHGRPQ